MINLHFKSCILNLALLQIQLQKNIPYFLKVRHLEKKMRLCLSKTIYLSYVQVHCLLDKAVVSAEEFATYSRFLIDFIKTSTLEIKCFSFE